MKKQTRKWIFYSWILIGLVGLPLFWVCVIGEKTVLSSTPLRFWFFASLFAYMIVGSSLGAWSRRSKKDKSDPDG